MTRELLSFFEKIESDLENQLINKEDGIKILKGDIPVLLSAPHSVEQIREGKIKFSETKTAPIVQYVHEQTGCYGAFKTMNFNDDANYDDENYYKDELINLVKKHKIKVLFDLHIMAAHREHNIDIGTGRGENIFQRNDIREIIKRNFERNDVDQVKVDHLFAATFKNTVSATVARECKIPCFQIEFNWKLLDETLENNQLRGIISAMEGNIKDLKEIL